MPPLILEAFEGKNRTVPVWFMRQAGRYLPQYRALKQKYSLNEMFRNPEVAAQITCQPVELLNVDAAILFADILTLPGAMGFKIKFDDHKGPVIENTLQKTSGFKHLHDFEDLSYVADTIKLVNQALPSHVPLIGFAGSPFTLLTYLIEGGSSINYSKTFDFLYKEPKDYQKIMDLLTENTIRYLNLQKEAGIKVFQIFDTWAGVLRAADYARLVLPYVRRIFKGMHLPSIYYVKNCSHLLGLMNQSEADFLSVCHTVVLGHHTVLEHTQKGIQGNFFNGLLTAEDAIIKREVNDVLAGARKHSRYIFNLSHGVLPNTDPQKLKSIVDHVHNFKWSS